MPPSIQQQQQEQPSFTRRLLWYLVTRQAFFIGLFLRIFLAWCLPRIFEQDNALIPGVDYTDIDYHVYTDAAAHVKAGGSPYDRTTYRYTPFLAALLAQLPSYKVTSRYLFCIADAICGYIIILQRRHSRVIQNRNAFPTSIKECWQSPQLQDALGWLYHPLAINICTRGSAEPLQVLLPVLMTLGLITTKRPSYRSVFLAGIWHGVAVHCKLYPVIYSLSYVMYIAHQYPKFTRIDVGKSKKTRMSSKSILHFCFDLVKQVLQPGPLLFGLASVASFVALTLLAVHFYGQEAWDEGFAYHFGRVDHRHNYSMHWYWIYLARATASASFSLELVGRLLLLPPAVLVAVTSIVIAPTQLPLALFVQTFLFVAFNKVLTAQYFTWYLCLLPLCTGTIFKWTPQVQRATIVFLVAMVTWLLNAYLLEMQGMAWHLYLWIASVVFFAAHLSLLRALLLSVADDLDDDDDAAVTKRHVTTRRLQTSDEQKKEN